MRLQNMVSSDFASVLLKRTLIDLSTGLIGLTKSVSELLASGSAKFSRVYSNPYLTVLIFRTLLTMPLMVSELMQSVPDMSPHHYLRQPNPRGL